VRERVLEESTALAAHSPGSNKDEETTRMKKLSIVCTMAVFVATGFALPAMAQDQNVAGTWNGTVRLRVNNTFVEDAFTLMLKQDGQAVTGTFSKQQGGTGSRGGRTEEGTANGSLAGDKLSLKIGKQRWLEATVNGDSMSGNTGFANNPPGSLTATRAK
jgi:hypothetical protein